MSWDRDRSVDNKDNTDNMDNRMTEPVEVLTKEVEVRGPGRW